MVDADDSKLADRSTVQPDDAAIVTTVRRPISRNRIALTAIAVLGLLVIATLGSFAFGWTGSDAEQTTFVIPDGSAETLDIPTIDSAIEVPTDLVFEKGDVLVIRNEDSVANRAGPWVLAAGETLRMTFDTPGEYFYLCTVDAAESVTVTVIDET